MKKLLLLCFCITLIADSNIEKLLENVKEHYYEGEYKEAIEVLEKATSELEKLESKKRTEAYMYLAFSYMAFGDEDSAREQFHNILEIDPNFELDPQMVAPKIVKLFEEVKTEMKKRPEQPPADVQVEEKPTTFQEEIATQNSISRKDVIWRSALVPGLGQLKRGSKGIGYTAMGAWVASIGFTVFAHVDYSAKKDDYDSAITPRDAADRYDDYNAAHKMKNFSYGLLAGVWTASLLEAALVNPENEKMSLYVNPLDCQIALRISF